jgi:RNA polymerase sigma-70 factor (ECF subfamily)
VNYSESLRLSAEQTLDAAAIEGLVATHRPKVYRLALSILDDPAEADEAAQDALLAALKALDSYRGEAAFSTWLYTITLNVCRARLRKRQTAERLFRTLKTFFWPAADKPRLPEENAILSETEADVWRAVNELDEKHRLPIILRYYHDFSTDEIARMLTINEGTVRSRLHTAREQLRVRLNGRLEMK